MDLVYLGIDVAGADNTWVAGLSPSNGSLETPVEPHLSSLERIVERCTEHHVVAVAIDAQLTMSLSAERGFRESDRRLRALLPPDCRNWVASVNSLMAVPVRGRLLSDHLAPVVGTILETHPRVSLLFGLGERVSEAVRAYKGHSAEQHVSTLWRCWSDRFGIASGMAPRGDGALDALVCATVAYLYHRAPENLLRLENRASSTSGRGPFYVIAPATESE